MNVSLTKALEDYVRAKVASGRYNNASEVVREALRGMEAREKAEADHLAWLQAEIKKGDDDIAAGRVHALDIEAIIAEGRARNRRKAA